MGPIGVDFGSSPGTCPQSLRNAPMHLSLSITFCPPIFWFVHAIFLTILRQCMGPHLLFAASLSEELRCRQFILCVIAHETIKEKEKVDIMYEYWRYLTLFSCFDS